METGYTVLGGKENLVKYCKCGCGIPIPEKNVKLVLFGGSMRPDILFPEDIPDIPGRPWDDDEDDDD